jgi:cardiolipin synthase
MTRPAFDDDLQELAAGARKLAERLPHAVMVALSRSIAQNGGGASSTARQIILQGLPTAEFREATADFLDLWGVRASRVGPETVGLALLVATESRLAEQQRQQFEIVWTGPAPDKTTFRQTEQAVLEVVDSATKWLTIVAYAVYRIPRVREALVAAARRGVRIRLIVETPNRIEGQNEYDTIIALGADVDAVSSVYFWPQENRAKADNNGKLGILHVKCVVADGHRLFLSSANLTEQAFTINMELGVLATGGNLADQVESHFDRLIESGILVRI